MRTSNQLNQMRLNGARHFRVQAGLSLIELMVAIVIGLFLTLGLSTMFLNMYSTSQSQGTVNQAQENQRLALVILTNTVQLAGYFIGTGIPGSTSDGNTLLPTLASNNSDGTNFLPGAGIVGKGAGTGTGVNPIRSARTDGTGRTPVGRRGGGSPRRPVAHDPPGDTIAR